MDGGGEGAGAPLPLPPPTLPRSLPCALGPEVPTVPALPAKVPDVVLVGPSITLRPFSLDDVEALYAAGCGDPYMGAPAYDAEAVVWRYLWWAAPESVSGIRDSFVALASKPDTTVFVVVDNSSGRCMGV
jgi:hypothetical protein